MKNKFTDFVLEKKNLILIITLFSIITITLGLVFGIRQKEKIDYCNLPECNPCIFAPPTSWSKCNKNGTQTRSINYTGHKKTQTPQDILGTVCNNKNETRNCTYNIYYILFYSSCSSDNIILQTSVNSYKNFYTLEESVKYRTKKISISNHEIVLINDTKIKLVYTDNSSEEITNVPYCIPDNKILSEIHIIEKEIK